MYVDCLQILRGKASKQNFTTPASATISSTATTTITTTSTTTTSAIDNAMTSSSVSQTSSGNSAHKRKGICMYVRHLI